jgi:hypothetical protein
MLMLHGPRSMRHATHVALLGLACAGSALAAEDAVPRYSLSIYSAASNNGDGLSRVTSIRRPSACARSATLRASRS